MWKETAAVAVIASLGAFGAGHPGPAVGRIDIKENDMWTKPVVAVMALASFGLLGAQVAPAQTAQNDVRQEDRQADRQQHRREDRRMDRREDRRADRRDDATERPERAERPEHAERMERAERADRADRSGRH